MPEYRVMLKPSADRQLQRLPRTMQRRIVAALEALVREPCPAGVKKLAGAENLWRVRVGDFRVVYEVHDERLVVLVLRVAHRSDVYRGD